MEITSANNHVSIYNGITSDIQNKILWTHTFSDSPLVYIKVWSLTFYSDLRKPGLVPGESLSPATNFGSVLEKNWIYMMSNRMRNLHMHIRDKDH